MSHIDCANTLCPLLTILYRDLDDEEEENGGEKYEFTEEDIIIEEPSTDTEIKVLYVQEVVTHCI